MREILIVGGAPCKLCRAIAPLLRKLNRGQVSCYFEQQLSLHHEKGIDWQNVVFILIGLSSDSANKDSKVFRIEHDILKNALAHKIPVGIVRDPHGKITAPHLVEDALDAISLVVARQVNEGRELGGLYPNAHILTANAAGTHDVGEIAEAIARLLPEQKMIGEGIRQAPRGPVGGWANGALTD
jgi:hypothetical protein